MRNHKESGNRQQFVRLQGPTMESATETPPTAAAATTTTTTTNMAVSTANTAESSTTTTSPVTSPATTTTTTTTTATPAAATMPNATVETKQAQQAQQAQPTLTLAAAGIQMEMETSAGGDAIATSMDSSNGNVQSDKAKFMPLPLKFSAISVAKDNNGNNNNNNNINTNSNSNSNSNNNNNNNSNGNTVAYLALPRRHQFTPMSDASNASFSSASVAGSIQDDAVHDQCGLTQAGLEEYNIRASSYYDQTFHHQKQASYAQSEGYHSYVSSSDSTSATPFLDKLRQESDLLSRQSHHWSENDLSSVCSNSVAPSPIPLLSNLNGNREAGGSYGGGGGGGGISINSLSHNHAVHAAHHPMGSTHNSSESTSSTETLKWRGSMSDVSEASHATGYSAIAESVSSSQLIVHSSRVLTPKRHHSESVLYLHDNETTPGATAGSSTAGSPVAPTKHSPQISEDANTSNSSSNSNSSSSGSNLQPLAMRAQHRHSPSYPPVHTTMTLHHFQSSQQSAQPHGHKLTQLKRMEATQSSLPDIPLPSSLRLMHAEQRSPLGQSQSTGDLQQPQLPGQRPIQQQQHKSSISVTISSSEAVVTIAPQPPPSKPQLSKLDTLSCSAPNVTTEQSSGGFNNESYRSNHRLFPVSTYTEPVHSNTSQFVHHPKPQYSAGLHKSNKLAQTKLPVITQPAWHCGTVAERISDIERSSSVELPVQAMSAASPVQKYSYLEPSKTHRLSNPALKALQKNAVQSYFERQQQQQQKETQSMLSASEQQLLRPHSYQSLHGVANSRDSLESLRKSLPNNLAPMLGIPAGHAASAGQLPRLDCSLKPPPHGKPPSPGPPPPPPRSRSLLPNLLRRSSSASDYAEFRDQYQEQLGSPPAIKNISSAEKLSFNDCGMPPPPPPPRGRVAVTARRTSSASEYAPMREKLMLQQAAALAHQQHHPQQHMARGNFYGQQPQPQQGQQLAATNWAPERPPKNPNLRVPSPELPPPPSSTELDTSYTFDEPLPPPPPPEVLLPKPPPSPNRRNSFAGASTRRSQYTRTSSAPNEPQAQAQAPSRQPKVPPLVPKKPTTLTQSLRSGWSQTQANKATHKLQLNGVQASSNNSNNKAGNHTTNSRKRPHNPPPIMEHAPMDKQNAAPMTAPPPLMPRARPNIDNVIANNLEINQQKRSNSKASYLPRQSLEKLNNTDPDHGIYKLTLTSNEDLVSHNKPSYELLSAGVGSGNVGMGAGKLPNNLPDVLPLGVKLQQQAKPLPGQPGSPNGLSNDVQLRYGSNNNLATKSPTNIPPYTMIYASAASAPHQRYSTPAMGGGYKSKSPMGHGQHYTRSQSYDMNQQANMDGSPTQFMSQSHLDLKQTAFNLETTLEEVLPVVSTPPRLSPAQSDSSLSSSGNVSSLESSSANANENVIEPHIFRAELISTTLNTPPKPPKPPMNRQESLRENIEKITQLQSKLMSAHLCDTLMGNVGYGSTKPASPSPSVNSSSAQLLATESKEQNLAMKKTEPIKQNELNNSAAISQMDVHTDGLKLVQRSEIVLRVNPTTVEIACQTDELLDCDLGRLSLHASREEQQTRTTLQPRQRQNIEIDYDNLTKELLTLLSPNDKLIEILTPKIYKATTEYVSNLYNPDVPLRPGKRDVGTSTLMRMKSTASLGSEHKTVTVELQLTDLDSALINGNGDPESTNLIKQKLDELIKQLNRKIGALKREKLTIGDECEVNDQMGTDLLAKLTEKVRPSEASKFHRYIGDVGNVTSLLLSLSEQLAQTECSLEARAQGSDHEKNTLESKRDRLYEQLDEAKRLKADIDRRGTTIASLFGKHLSADECADYDYFINMKAKLIADARDLADKIKCSEEQLAALRDALVQSDC